MAIKTMNPNEKSGLKALSRFLGLAVLALLLISLGSVGCKKAEESVEGEEVAPVEEGVAIEEGKIEFMGEVEKVNGKYMYIPEVQGFDIVIQGSLDSGDMESLVGKEVKGEGEFSPERPSILVANSVEIKDDAGNWNPAFTRTEEFVLEDYLDLNTRNTFEKLEDIAYDKKDSWEGKGQGKVYGKLEEEDGAYKIAVLDEDGDEVGKIVIDSFSDYGLHYVNKLGLFDRFWFYLNINETVDWSVRRRSREMFHADVLFAGLF